MLLRSTVLRWGLNCFALLWSEKTHFDSSRNVLVVLTRSKMPYLSDLEQYSFHFTIFLFLFCRPKVKPQVTGQFSHKSSTILWTPFLLLLFPLLFSHLNKQNNLKLVTAACLCPGGLTQGPDKSGMREIISTSEWKSYKLLFLGETQKPFMNNCFLTFFSLYRTSYSNYSKPKPEYNRSSYGNE